MKDWDCYLAGGMSGLSFAESNNWRVVATKLLGEFEGDYKVKTINPNDYYNFVAVTYDSEEEIRRFDIRLVEKSDLIFVNLNGKSIGTSMELQHAFDRNIPIIGFKDDGEDLHPWLQCVCDKVFKDMGKGIEYIKEYYLN